MIDFNLAARATVTPPPTLQALPDWAVANDLAPGGLVSRQERRATMASVPLIIETARQSKFVVENFDGIRPLALGWRVKGLWPAIGVCIVAGASMSGKSFWALNAIARVCRGQSVAGRKSKPCGVLYIASEGAGGVRNRIDGLRRKVGTWGGRLAFIGQAPNLTDEDDVEDLRATIAETRASMAVQGGELGMVVVDTLSASTPGADENSAKDMSPVLAALQTLALDFDLLVLVIAHTGKDETRGVRGWSGLKANADGLIMFEGADAEGVRVGEVVKVKDGASGDKFAFALVEMEIGRDEDGDAITTCTVEEVAMPDRPKTGRSPTKAMATADLILKAFNRIFEAKGIPMTAAGAEGAKGVCVADLRVDAYSIGVGPSEPDYGEYPDDASRKACKRKWQDQRKADFDRGRDHLVSTHRMRVEGGMIWPLVGR
ncbi:AAA family ATPase [Phenylobacterium sp.]|uniref:AAA family ATPase n=1 Tax=Phenylobacterium sp. TaxID=1871053 RepID=UPI003BAA1622